MKQNLSLILKEKKENLFGGKVKKYLTRNI